MFDKKRMRIIFNILIIVFSLMFFLAVLYYINGSLEMIPTKEQQEKARIGAIVLMLVTAVPLLVCVVIRFKDAEGKVKLL